MDTKKEDIAAIIGRSAAGVLPVVGPMLSELISNMIPNQRLDRLYALFKALESKVEELEKEKFEENLRSAESIDLFEDACLQAVRSLSHERTERIASLLKNTLTNEQIEHTEAKRLFSIFSEVNDIQVIILKYHSLSIGQNDFKELHKEVLLRPGMQSLTQKERKEKDAMFDSYRNHLVSLGLLRQNFERVRKNELPQIDSKTGMQKSRGYEITPLGRLLIRSIDEAENED